MELLNAIELTTASRKHPQVTNWLAVWEKVVRESAWKNLPEMRRIYPAADGVVLGKGREKTVVTVFNIGGNDYRLLTRISFEQQVVQVLDVLTHAEYSKNKWKKRYSSEKIMIRSSRKPLRDDYYELVRRFPLTKIQSSTQHGRALKASGRLIGLLRKLSAGEKQYLEVLIILIREYEQSKNRAVIRKVSGVDILRHLMSEQGMSQRQLAELLEVGESAASMILAGKRELTRSHITILSRHFGVGVGAFFQ